MTARARLLAAALIEAGVPAPASIEQNERFLSLLDPEGDPRLPDEELVAQVVEFFAELLARARATELTDSLIAHVLARRP